MQWWPLATYTDYTFFRRNARMLQKRSSEQETEGKKAAESREDAKETVKDEPCENEQDEK